MTKVCSVAWWMLQISMMTVSFPSGYSWWWARSNGCYHNLCQGGQIWCQVFPFCIWRRDWSGQGTFWTHQQCGIPPRWKKVPALTFAGTLERWLVLTIAWSLFSLSVWSSLLITLPLFLFTLSSFLTFPYCYSPLFSCSLSLSSPSSFLLSSCHCFSLLSCAPLTPFLLALHLSMYLHFSFCVVCTHLFPAFHVCSLPPSLPPSLPDPPSLFLSFC